MNERLKKLAEQSGFSREFSVSGLWLADDDELERFAELVRQDEANGMRETYMKMIHGAIAEEREACAKTLETTIYFKSIEADPFLLKLCLDVVGGCAQLIRARGNK
jgi:hypothetical protein